MCNSASHPRMRSTMANQELTIMFEHCTDQSYFPDSGAGSGRSSPASSSSPCTPIDVFPQSPLDLAVAAEDSWNLIPYDVPWGPEYYHYRTGTLPGPHGACIFLRSPTPLKNRRTQKACNKCRQRKAKCSGSRPACSRCLARGYLCEYAEEEKRTPSQNARLQRRRREHSECSSEPAETVDSPSDCESYHSIQPKVEEMEPSTPYLSYPDAEASFDSSSSSTTDYSPQCDDSQYAMTASYDYEAATETYADATILEYYDQPSYAMTTDTQSCYPQDASHLYHGLSEQHPAAASVHAPRPVRCTGSPSFLSPEGRMGAFAMAPGASGMHPNPMLINLTAAAGPEPAPRIVIPQAPPMTPTDPALDAAAVQYAQPQEMYYYPQAESAVQQFPYLQYHQYGGPTYVQAGAQESIAGAMLYAMPMPIHAVGMMA